MLQGVFTFRRFTQIWQKTYYQNRLALIKKIFFLSNRLQLADSPLPASYLLYRNRETLVAGSGLIFHPLPTSGLPVRPLVASGLPIRPLAASGLPVSLLPPMAYLSAR